MEKANDNLPAQPSLSGLGNPNDDTPEWLKRAVSKRGGVSRNQMRISDAPDILSTLPTPFEWCPVPAGRVTLEDDAGTFDVQPFWIAKYPLTYAQFQVFVDAKDGFKDPKWWQGLAADPEHTKQPADQHTKADAHPRERVSWWDAIAFCQWLNARLGLPSLPADLTTDRLAEVRSIRLPGEWEWQWAAQGPDGRAFPWGNVYVEGYPNIDMTTGTVGPNYVKLTTPVGSYPQGASPYGALDMSGHVSEWCLNEYKPATNIGLAGRNARVVRGGSWSGLVPFVRTATRNIENPDGRFNFHGFRVCVRPPSH